MKDKVVFYHGTKAGFRGRGGLLLPGDLVGKDNWHLKRSQFAYITTEIQLAYFYAYACKGRGRPKVLIVKPISQIENDNSFLFDDLQAAYTCSGAIVQKTILLPWMPIHNEDEYVSLLTQEQY